jgi:hypothetical protein
VENAPWIIAAIAGRSAFSTTFSVDEFVARVIPILSNESFKAEELGGRVGHG